MGKTEYMPSTVLKWPLELDSSGRLAVASSDAEAWDLRIKALLSTRTGERVMRTSYGCFLPERLFSRIHPTTPEEDIRNAVQRWLPLLEVIKVGFDEQRYYRDNGQQDRVIVVEVEYKTPSKVESTMSLSIVDKESR